jgi:hypothetical protein
MFFEPFSQPCFYLAKRICGSVYGRDTSIARDLHFLLTTESHPPGIDALYLGCPQKLRGSYAMDKIYMHLARESVSHV